MGTIFIIRDSVVSCLTQSAGASKIVYKEAETNGLDIWIIVIICLTFLVFAYIVKEGLIEWHKDKLTIQKETDKEKRNHELELKKKEMEFKENAEKSEHNRKVFNKVLDSVLKDKDQQSRTFTECVSKMVEDIKKKIDNFLKDICNEQK